MKVNELREKSIKELEELLAKNRAVAQSTYVDVTVKQEKSLKEYKSARTAIAQIMTILKEKETDQVKK